ncbi:MAG: Gfo/Idh/MocA family oxidoreductase [Pirellula sp.]|nr:Gfo/Idh/MocA family oxidoreductase [Pirellula sp.]
MQRRSFLANSSAGLAALGLSQAANGSPTLFDDKPTVIGIMGCSRGRDLLRDFLKIPNVTVKYVCDPDSGRVAGAAKLATDAGQKTEAIADFRKILDDKEVDALICAAPNHWHGPATIMGCNAGKHVYVEKPACHNPQEGEWMVAAAQKANKCVQVGTQRRSGPGYQEAIAKLHAGAIGKVYLSRCFFNRLRGSIGTGKDEAPPNNLAYDLWQGPAPKRPYRSNVVHYNWHWFWHWGNGELGNNGVHGLDVCRWGLQVDYPIRTVSSGGRYCYQDDQETPDTQQVAWEFEGGKQITYQGLSCTQHPPGALVSFYGTEGYMEIDGDGVYSIYDSKNKLSESGGKKAWGQEEHLKNFIDAIRANDPKMLAQPILSGHQSTLLCHLGNIAQRTGEVVKTSSKNGKWADGVIPNEHWRREYDPQWEKWIVS